MTLPNFNKCEMVSVLWMDACIVASGYEELSKAIQEDKPLCVPSISVGFLFERENEIVLIHSFSNDKPVDYTVIPKGWVVNITLLTA